MPEPQPKSMDELVSLCKRRGFIYPASEIYGGLNGFWDYGPLGTLLKKNLADDWWRSMVLTPPRGLDRRPVQIVGVDSAIIQNPKVWEASGHVAGFNDPMVDDRETKQRFRADHLMGLYRGIGSKESEALEHFRARAVDATLLPDVTVVASGPDEAVALLDTDKALRKRLGIRSFTATPHHLEDSFRVAQADIGGKTGLFFVSPVSSEELERAPDRVPSPFTGKPGSLTEPRQFNLMFETYVGAIRDEDAKAYLRPETAQGIFTNFKNVCDTMRVRMPFGIAQIGKAFRNEVTPRNYIFRSREFEQMEMEWFCHESEAGAWLEYWKQQRFDWWLSVGLSRENLTLRQHEPDELAHYAKSGHGTWDIEYRWPFTHPGFGELEGVAHRSNYDLTQHEQASGQKLSYFDQERNERFIPHVIEPAAGLTRGVLALLCEAFTPDESRPSKVFMKFDPRMAPIKAAVYPLVNKDGMPEVAEKLHDELTAKFGRLGMIEYDPKQNIGKRYARMDEAGCPFCFTIDSDTLKDQSVTVRHRDDQRQERIGLDAVAAWLGERIL
jgi:glycyl-tRNA synthetase